MADAYTQIADNLKTVLDAEFTPLVAVHDNLHEALGRRRAAIGIAPMSDTSWVQNRLVSEHWIEVKFYDLWTDEITPETVIDPRAITAKAHRFKRALWAYNKMVLGTKNAWFFDVDRITYTDDPTGNRSRFVAMIRAYGNNAALTETTA